MINTKKLLPSSTSSLAKISNSGNRYSNFNVGPEKKSNGVSEVSDKLTNIHKFLKGSDMFISLFNELILFVKNREYNKTKIIKKK